MWLGFDRVGVRGEGKAPEGEVDVALQVLGKAYLWGQPGVA